MYAKNLVPLGRLCSVDSTRYHFFVDNTVTALVDYFCKVLRLAPARRFLFLPKI